MDLAWSFVNVLTLGIVWGFDRRMTWQIASVSARIKLSLAGQRTKLDLGNQFCGSLCFVECCVGVLDNRLASHYLKHRNEMLGFYYLNFYINYPGIKIVYTQY